VNEQVQKIQEQLHLGATPYLLYVVLGIIFLGYLLTSTSLYKHLKGTIANRFPTGNSSSEADFLSMGTLYVLNVSAFSRSSDIILQGRKNVWIDKCAVLKAIAAVCQLCSGMDLVIHRRYSRRRRD